ncbi:hypothetical protein [Ensifer sp. BR816]|uniref:hypothetical protein n=1 Tax=Rhizobium sp. (strain BR816) TaxID=1057002 RepID=UPI000A03FB3C|nr:hypothetical protein [Ensifer sp. BR816]
MREYSIATLPGDGIGPEMIAAGRLSHGTNTLARMNKCGFNPKEMLARHDSYAALRPSGISSSSGQHQHQRHPRHPHQRELANET